MRRGHGERMEIKNNPIIKATGAYAKAANTAKKAEEKKSVSGKTDTLELSSDSPRNLNTDAVAKEIAAELDAPSNENKILALKAQIEQGAYNPSAIDVAKAILNVD